jgi:hypothetical protein
MQFDVCHGDADGLCAVVQWRLQNPPHNRLVCGLKRDIELLQSLPANRGDEVLVCDLSLRRNYKALQGLLNRGVRVHYFDHHAVTDIPEHPMLDAHINTSPSTCTCLLMDHYLGGRSRGWAIVGAFGDNLGAAAEQLASTMHMAGADVKRLQTLGEAINHNAYGESAQDVHILPADLFDIMVRYADPLAFLAHESIGHTLNALRQEDLGRAHAVVPCNQNTQATVYLLPDEPWGRRVMGSMGNTLAREHPNQAHALLKATRRGGFTASVRAPLNTPSGAVELCRQFGGAGRAGAAGIDHLPNHLLGRFVDAFMKARWGTTVAPKEAFVTPAEYG